MEEVEWLISTSIFLIIFLSLFKFTVNKQTNQTKLPPSPPALPVIGHLHHLIIKQPLHRTLHNLTHKYGHIFFLRLGTRNVVVVSSPSAVENCFTNNDITFANRPRTLVGKHLHYNYTSILFASYGHHWRNLRRLTTLELLSTNRLAKFANIREEEVKLLVKQIFEECKGQGVSKVELRPKLAELSFNIMLRMITGKRYYGKDVVAQEAKEFQCLIREVAELHESGNLNDFFPIFQWIDFQGLEKRMVKVMKKMDRFLENLIDEHRKNRCTGTPGNGERNMTLIDVMLDLQETEPEFCTDETVKGVIQVMLLAGSESTNITMEWALSLLLNHPEAMNKTMVEIDTYVGQEQLLNDLDTSKLIYLQDVITETLRLYPVAPLLFPHETSNDCKIGDFDIPRGTMLLVNLWTLQKDAKWWKNPSRFEPERFERGKGGEMQYSLIPFGIGRRACPGAVLAKRVLIHALGALIQSFEWNKIGDEDINMIEGTGITLTKVEPLVALCRPRQSMIKVLSNI